MRELGFTGVWPVARVLALVTVLIASGCERPPVDSVQRGHRGTGIVQVYNPRALEAAAGLNAAPEVAPPARLRANAPQAGNVYQNVQVLGHLSIAEFARTMDAMSQWVSPNEGSCNYCHVEGNLADDSKYTKKVARRMLQMTQALNTEWKAHVGKTGVTCYTCHRGQALPAERWFNRPPQDLRADFIGNRNGQNAPERVVGRSSLPGDPFGTYFRGPDAAAPSIRVYASSALPTGPGAAIQDAEATYGLMMHMSSALGVNCTYCHNSRSFADWAQSSPQRVTAWQGIRMVRDLNGTYLESLAGTFPEIPAGRLGPGKDVAKVQCATCHRGAYKPLYGARTAEHYPALLPPPPVADAASAGG